MTNSVWLHKMFWPDVAEHLKTSDTVLVPIGATEQHGPHTALFVDTAWASDVSEAVAKQEGVLIAPPMHFGYSQHHLAYPGGITLRAETLTQVALDIGESLISHGFRKVIFVNGNRIANLPPLQIAMVKLRYRTGAFAGIIDTHLIARREVCEVAVNLRDASNHAGDVETSFMMHAHPEFVRPEKMEKLAERGRPAFSSVFPMDPPFDQNIAFTQDTADEFFAKTEGRGVYSDPTAATKEKGEKILDVTVQRAADFVRQVKALKVDCPKCPIPV
ncbi:MAG: creatininase family protein [Rhodobacterales bacterium]|nr:creatininase family protein [Rhodobacterales bacterium]